MSLVQVRGLSKAYGGVQALADVHLEIRAGVVHALCGENGAGKSTLIKVLGGVVAPDSGTVSVSGEDMILGSVRDSERSGIAVIHQESVAFPHLNAVDNLFVGREHQRFGWLNRPAMRRETAKLMAELGESIDIGKPLERLPLAQRQMVAIARGLHQRCKLLILDEPTASLSERETLVLFEQIRKLRSKGVSVLYVSHRLHEIFTLADRVTVLRDGRWVCTEETSELDEDLLIQRMVGRSLSEVTLAPGNTDGTGETVLEVEGLSRAPSFHNVSLELRAGEVLGLGGLVGAGRSEVARCVFGVDAYDSGSVEVEGEQLEGGTVRASCEAGIALVPEDRQHEGLVQPLAISHNLGLPWFAKLSRYGVLRKSAWSSLVQDSVQRLDVRLGTIHDPVASLSGGNQQKVVLGKWLAGRPKVLILDEPTRGVDVGAKEEVYRLVQELAADGVGILLISSDMPELIRLSHRVLVMSEGRVRGALEKDEITEEAILRLALPDSGRADLHGEAIDG